jgi:two-component system sensor histidine kinase/response regulator
LLTDCDIRNLVQRFGIEGQRTRGVLLVDDEGFNLQVLRSFLEDGWRVHDAESGEQALAVAEREPLDVVVADQRMPGMTGVELLEELRRRRPDVAGIVLTGYSDMQALESAINRANVFRFLRKPWEPPEILEAIEQASAHVAQQRTIQKLVALLASRTDELQDSVQELRSQQRLLLDLERTSTIGRLASGITHDLRNVIVGLRTAEWEMAQTTVSPPLRDVFTLSLSSIDNLLRTLQLLHEYARTGSLALQLTAVEPAAVVQDALAISRMDRLFRLRRVQSEIGARLPVLRADRQKLTQVLVNLVRNALHATRDGAAVHVLARGRSAGEVEFAVEDEGSGIAPEVREKLFQPFASTKGGEGLGMGLYMARLIVELHRGSIAAVDRARGGTRFEVVLPTGVAAEAISAVAEEAS